ncbi:hypothetical protein [Streptomyces sp. UNOC14_S4]|uniref:hypothetical protein n=1 Tax=Streptomyces sp. UNOC14_S4 TaxID=2872340 RepID=UPI001E5AEC01|nr:hypothetical protein [Streptomyces sp. UNOC14_S4]MCC3766196.1 hypothetical protein [Streptomyces sp. UNOC14_S4]
MALTLRDSLLDHLASVIAFAVNPNKWIHWLNPYIWYLALRGGPVPKGPLGKGMHAAQVRAWKAERRSPRPR